MGVGLDFLRIARAQTAAVEGAGFPLAAYLGGAPVWSLPLFALFGILAHFGGFGENSVSDIEFDRVDPNKRDHPVVSGRIAVRNAMLFVYACQVLGILLFAAVLEARGHLLLVPIAAFAGYVVLGHAYNFLGKRWKPGAVLEISGAFALAFLACGTAWTGRLSEPVGLVGAFAFAWVAYQIAALGEGKEIAVRSEKNLLRQLGMETSADGTELRSSHAAFAFTGALTWVKIGVLGVIAWQFGSWRWFVPVVIVSMLFLRSMNDLAFLPGRWDRTRFLRLAGICEAGGYLLLVLAVAPRLGAPLVVVFVALPVLWFVGLNRLLWSRTGSAWAPGV
jgi:4-hydroxybenzoate polyprenyltransferase